MSVDGRGRMQLPAEWCKQLPGGLPSRLIGRLDADGRVVIETAEHVIARLRPRLAGLAAACAAHGGAVEPVGPVQPGGQAAELSTMVIDATVLAYLLDPDVLDDRDAASLAAVLARAQFILVSDGSLLELGLALDSLCGVASANQADPPLPMENLLEELALLGVSPTPANRPQLAVQAQIDVDDLRVTPGEAYTLALAYVHEQVALLASPVSRSVVLQRFGVTVLNPADLGLTIRARCADAREATPPVTSRVDLAQQTAPGDVPATALRLRQPADSLNRCRAGTGDGVGEVSAWQKGMRTELHQAIVRAVELTSNAREALAGHRKTLQVLDCLRAAVAEDDKAKVRIVVQEHLPGIVIGKALKPRLRGALTKLRHAAKTYGPTIS
ncbi:hypothetical protein M8C13_38595 [Crossiella sp. SN42]|uniref:hypothetical protein n=1 Tax=Crossiella sp. SN42 TaxID=2944808 RepID=UPI00207C75C8|nr:hypothetical protein [Crossiella sp. SN42]MCO1581675.1 hypothetical protein [Crossiella sp. SN42]